MENEVNLMWFRKYIISPYIHMSEMTNIIEYWKNIEYKATTEENVI